MAHEASCVGGTRAEKVLQYHTITVAVTRDSNMDPFDQKCLLISFVECTVLYCTLTDRLLKPRSNWMVHIGHVQGSAGKNGHRPR